MNRIGRYSSPGKLIGVERLGVSSVVLVEVRELVVEEHWGFHLVWNCEVERALPCCDIDSCVCWSINLDHLLSAPGWLVGAIRTTRILVEVQRHEIVRHVRSSWVYWGILVTS